MKEKITVTDETIWFFVHQEIGKYGDNADLNHIDVSRVTNMRDMFANSKFNGDISGWDVSNVEDMSGMFANSAFTGDISNWRLSDVEKEKAGLRE